ncbi:MAG: cbb3-type cytochrome c oxidase subunit 3 [Candidatus Eisenbacteria bacterium]
MRLTDVMSHAGLAGYAEFALVLFMLAFLGIVWAAFRPGNKPAMDAAARMPIDDESTGTPEEETRS